MSTSVAPSAVSRMTLRLPAHLKDKLRKLSAKSGAPHAHHVRKALEDYLSKQEK